MRGEVVYTFVYDLGGEVNLDRVGALLDELPTVEALTMRKTAPRYVDLPRPLTVSFPSQALETSVGPVRLDVTARVFALGALSLTLRTPVEVPDWGSLQAWGSLRVMEGEEERRLGSWATTFFRRLAAGLEPALTARYEGLREPEPYVTYALSDVGKPASRLLVEDRRELAGLLANDPEPERLSEAEVDDNLRHWLQYYEDDLVVADWEYALVVEPSGQYADVLYVMELANLELLELRAFDKYLDDVLEDAYGDLDRFFGRGLFASPRDIQRDLSEARMDLTRLRDALENAGKIYGDYFLGKLHQQLKERFHLDEWEQTVNEKMRTLGDLYTVASQEVGHRQALLLEAAIVLLFIVDLVAIFGLGH